MIVMMSNMPLFDPQLVDNQLLATGGFSPLHYLLDSNLLPYAAYEQWRNGEFEVLDAALSLSLAEVLSSLQAACHYVEKRSLQAETQAWFGWRGNTRHALVASRDPMLASLLGQHWQPLDTRMQLDLFMDNTAVVAENKLCDYLAAHQWALAESAYAELVKLSSRHALLAHYESLISYGFHLQEEPQVAPEQLREEWQGLEHEVAPLAQEVLRGQARDYLAVAWRRLAESLENCHEEVALSSLHASQAWVRLPDWSRVVQSIVKTQGYAQQFELCQRLAEAHFHTRQFELSLLQYAALIQIDTERAESLFDQHHACGRIDQYWKDFNAQEVESPSALFPGYLLLVAPGLLAHVTKEIAPRFQHGVVAAVISLLQCKREGRDEVAARRALKEISPTLLKLYLKR